MPRTLEGYSVLVTRPEEQAGPLIAEIEQRGGQVVFAPMIVIRPKRKDPHATAVIKRLHEFHSVIFVSKNAVDFGIELIRAQHQTLDHCQVYAVGVGSAGRLHDLGIAQVHTPHSEFTSEGLLKLPGLSSHQIDGKKVLIVRGAGGRELLAQTLTHRGAYVEYCEVYERTIPTEPLSRQLKACGISTPDVGILTSLEALTNLADKIDQEKLELLYDVPLLVVGARTAQEVERLGFTLPPMIVDNPGDHSIVEALERWVVDEQ
ncbi:MAG: uroporphyrinogen-III synthase [Gammaproteobacteria bacterium]|nr:uroporphyrinogen-III synthase [Gammaproteobacteria bacterium]